MPNGSNLNITVSLVDVGGTKKVQADPATATRGSTPLLIWVPATTDFEITFIGFNDPVGDGKDIAQPQKVGATRNWSAFDKNQTAKVWEYSIFAISNGIVYSSDPQIVNEGQGGLGGDEPGGGG